MKKIENEILEEIIRRVLEKDDKFKTSDEFKKMQNATIDTLDDMTSLSKGEIDTISKEVQDELLKKYSERRQVIFYIILGILLVAFVLFLLLIKIKLFSFLFLGAIVVFIILFLKNNHKNKDYNTKSSESGTPKRDSSV